MRFSNLIGPAGLLTVTLVAAAWSGDAPARDTTTTAICHGCSASQMRQRAARSSSGGTVWVFNQPDETVRRYQVRLVADERRGRYRVTREVEELPVPGTLKQAWRRAAGAANDLEDAFIVLPPDFPVPTVARALLSPDTSATRIEAYLASLSAWRRFENTFAFMLAQAASHNVPVVGGILKTIRIVVQFPSGDTAEYEVSIEAVLDGNDSSRFDLELGEPDDARLVDGEPAPTAGGDWIGFSLDGSPESVLDWVWWARENGIRVTGPGGGDVPNCPSEMSCTVSGAAIRCTVTGSRC